jgi:type I restriction enzyme R subunit
VAEPEAEARERIDTLLEAAGWAVQDRTQMNLGAAPGIAVREFPLATGYADYLLIVDRKALGVIEAKPVGVTLSGVESQSAKYKDALKPPLKAWRDPLPFLYESTGVETYFTNDLDPEPRSRRVFAFHTPEMLLAWAKETETLRMRLRAMPPLMTAGLWPAQIEAVGNLEQSLADDRPRALIQMATGSGKTFTAINAVYRLIKHAGARRVLFLVDRANLGKQALNEFQQFDTPDDGRKFTELYTVQRLASNYIDSGAKVVITTIQRLFSILSDEAEFDAEEEEQSAFSARGAAWATMPPKTVEYKARLPIEFFDCIVVDECHRSIYNLWRQALEYFDAYIIGLTATPAKQTFGFFNQNLVMEYQRQRAVVDGVNVDGQVYRIRTAITERGSTVDAFEVVGKRDRQTRAVRWEQLDDDFTYGANELDRAVVVRSQIRTIIRAYRDNLFTEIFPGRSHVPKTLIFAKDDDHAEEIVRIVRDEFGKGNEFCQKITYRVSGVKADDLISAFRNQYNPRIAVTVDMIATGTDIKPLEVLLFMRNVKSRVQFEQMLGRGTRVVDVDTLQGVTPDAPVKDRFVIVDAVGVVDEEKGDTQALERKRSVSFERLLEAVAAGADDDETLSSLAGRFALLDKRVTAAERAEIATASGGKSLHDLATALLDAIDPDVQRAAAATATGEEEPGPDALADATAGLLLHAVAPLDDPLLRHTLLTIQRRNEQTLDEVSLDTVREAGFSVDDTERARATVASFERYIAEHTDEITALQLLYAQPYRERRATFTHLKRLAERLQQPPHRWTAEALWQAYARLERDKVRGVGEKRVVTDLVSLVRHAVHVEDALIPYPETVRERYAAWLAQQETAGMRFTEQQRWWLDRIAAYIGVNLSFDVDDFDYDGELSDRGGQIAAARVFGKDLPRLLNNLNGALVA